MRRTGLVAAVMVVLIWSTGPFLWMLLTSFKSPGQIDARPPEVLPDLDLGFYRTAFQEQDLLRYVVNSAVVAACTSLLAVSFGALAAYPLARMRIPFRRTVLGAVLLFSMFPQVAIAGGVYRLVDGLGLLNTRAGLVLPYTGLTLPLAVWILVSFFQEIPRGLEDAARVDGCGPLVTLWRVFLPVAAPSVAVTAILVFIHAWNEFFFALLITTDPAFQTLPVGIARFPGLHEVPWGELAAAAVVAALPLVVVVLVLGRRITRGLTAGTIKG